MYDETHAHCRTDLLEVHFLELVKFRGDKPRALRTPLEKWLHVLKSGDLYESASKPLPEERQQEEGIGMAIDRLRSAWANDEFREWRESREKARMDEKNRLEYARRQGVSEDLELGKQKGLELGRQQGLELGKQQGLLEAAKRMLAEGVDRESACRILGLAPTDLP